MWWIVSTLHLSCNRKLFWGSRNEIKRRQPGIPGMLDCRSHQPQLTASLCHVPTEGKSLTRESALDLLSGPVQPGACSALWSRKTERDIATECLAVGGALQALHWPVSDEPNTGADGQIASCRAGDCSCLPNQRHGWRRPAHTANGSPPRTVSISHICNAAQDGTARSPWPIPFDR